MPTQISLHAVTKTYGDRTVLDGVTCAVAPGERAGIIGENGSGKSTLLRLLAGREKPDEGQVTVVATAGVGYLGQEAPLPTYLRVRQVIDGALAELRTIEARLRELEPLLADGDDRRLTEYGDLTTVFELRGGYGADARVARTLHALGLAGVDHDRRLDSLSGGEQARLHLAAVLAAGSEILLLDEPTNHLDDDSLTWLEEHLRVRAGTTVVVSHDRVFLERVASTLIEVDGDRRTLTRYGDGYAGYLTERAAARRRWAEAHLRWRTEVDRTVEAAAATARQVAPGRMMKDRNKVAYDRDAGRVQQSLASRVRNAEQRLRRLYDQPVPPPPEPLRFTPPLPGTATDGILLDAAEVTVAGRLFGVRLTVRGGDRLLIDGPNGAGKSTLLRVLAGELAPDAGRLDRPARIGYLPQETSVTRSRETLLTAFGRGLPGPPDTHRDRLLSLGLFEHDRLDVPVRDLSTGQRRRLALARLLSQPADLLLLDEPTNHLSPGLVEEMEAALADYPGALLVVSHDRRLRQRWRGEHRAMADGRLPAPRSTFPGSRPEEGNAMRRHVPLSIQEIPVSGPDAGPYGVAVGPDGALWSTLVHAGKIIRLGVDGQVDSYPLDDPACGPSVITPGSDGALWFTRLRDHRIGRITTRGEITSYPVPTPDCGPYGITTGPDGALWFTETNTDRIGRISTDGTVTEYPLPTSGGFPSAITAGPDGALWFTLNQANSIGRLGQDGVPTLHPLPTPGAAPVGITAGSDGAVWFVEIGAGQLGRITPDGRIQEFPLPDRSARPHAIVADPAGGCWFTEWGANRVGWVTAEGEIGGYDLPTPGSEPHGMTVGPDRAIWVALEIGSIARLAP
ncbi:ATP-binding cassette domain-containing protein [Plantactinospora sp. S1510]|uniref:Virginiamycin B lyase n=1 Tax=Plantactinospora alkalitolerans TaxID=2789879 RepID=A0ABS0GYX0_9ACTN|nr:ATP-binding cassette domain-containing protein [Plantactinospora alkalitolerans]